MERSLTDRVLSLYERARDDGADPPTISAVLSVAEAVEELEDVVYRGRPCPPRQQQENPT